MATDILCRFDPAQATPVVFLRDTIQNDKIQVWNGAGNPKYMPLDYYKMTSPLSADDERVLMERFKTATGKQDQVIRITHRLPRTSRPLPNMLTSSVQETPSAPVPRKSNAKSIDAQSAPNGPTGDLPQAGEVPAPMPVTTTPKPLPVDPNEPPSAGMFRRLQELNLRMAELAQRIASLDMERQNATTDYDTAKEACKELTIEYGKAIEQEAADELRKRKEALANLTANTNPLAVAAQALHDTETAQAPVEPPKADPAPATSKARGTGGRFKKAPAPAGK